MAKVGIVMGSDSDMPVMAKAAEILDKFGIDYEMTIISAHREPDLFFKWAKAAEEKGAVCPPRTKPEALICANAPELTQRYSRVGSSVT